MDVCRSNTLRAPSHPANVRDPVKAARTTGKRNANDAPESASPNSSISVITTPTGSQCEGNWNTVRGDDGVTPSSAFFGVHLQLSTSALHSHLGCDFFIDFKDARRQCRECFVADSTQTNETLRGNRVCDCSTKNCHSQNGKASISKLSIGQAKRPDGSC